MEWYIIAIFYALKFTWNTSELYRYNE